MKLPTFLSSCLPPAVLALSVARTTASSTGNVGVPPPTFRSPYESVTALDEYGNSAQLRNAREASARRGALVVAALAASDEGNGTVVVVCSHRPGRPGVKPSTSSDRAVHVIGSDDESTATGSSFAPCAAITAVAFTGLRSDSNLLLSLLRDHARRTWERYGTVPDASRVAGALSEVFLSFMGYDRSEELTDGAGPVVPGNDEEDEEGFSMARPFGVQAMAVGVRPGVGAELRCVDPSGVRERYVGRAMGRGEREANAMLSSRWKSGMDTREVRDLCVGIIRDVVKGEGCVAGDSLEVGRWDDAEILFETLSASEGLTVTRLPFVEKMA